MTSDAPDFTVPSVLLDRYLVGECTPDERARVEAWARVHGAEGAIRVLQHGDEPSPTPAAVARQAADWVTIRRRLGLESAGVERGAGERPHSPPHRPVVSDTWRGRRWGALASLAVVVGVFGVAMSRMHPGALSSDASPGMGARGLVYRTAVGQIAVVTLGDGSRVTLAPQTTLRLDRGFGASNRAAALSGEARFDVVDGTRLPFVVQTGSVRTQVLGTAFIVRRYSGDATTHVAVLSGKVTVAARTVYHPSVTLSAGTVGVVNDSLATLTSEGTDAYAAWTDGRLVFHNAPTPEVLAVLARWYGYEFRLTDSSLATQNLTVWLSTTSAQAALATLKLALDADLAFDGNTITLSPRWTARRAAPRPRDRRDIFPAQGREVGR